MLSSCSPGRAEELNKTCQCVGTDVWALRAALDADLAEQGVRFEFASSHPHLYSQLPVFVSADQAQRMQAVIAALVHTIALPDYREAVLAAAPPIAKRTPLSSGVFFGYDFHLGQDGPQLIEINTNAGGAYLCLAMLRAQQACCEEVGHYLRTHSATQIEERLVDMFVNEWRLARGAQPLKTVALVDDDPTHQYLYPEFLLWKRSLERRGINALVIDAAELRFAEGVLWAGDIAIDLVYNRLTDFYLDSHPALAEAHAVDAVVLTPHPHAHALYANKRNLALLTDERELSQMGVPTETVDVLLGGIPKVVPVYAADQERWWQQRKEWFFKPATGFGGRGSYRGDKLTRKTLSEIARGGYIAQRCVPPSERWIHAGDDRILKFDVRNFVYEGTTQLTAARIYQGQTTNFRTEGGGFAPVYPV